ncbi:MAG: polyphosphate polymerase domain-containing protein [Verrucomicrobia bacterium]|nr:polyphosphate polymerase domain-containing protein [Verrucomicrobiota bacterium]
MTTDKLQLQRLELKYHISEAQALAVRDFVRCYLEIDEFGATQPNLSYRIHSLYLDSDDLKTYWDTINSNKNRFKLRLRYYDDAPSSPVFFEVKRRMDNAILKQRGGVRRVAVPGLLAGQLPEPEHLLTDQPKPFFALQRFSQLMLSLRARPKVHICYLREAWMNHDDNSVRVTMDRDVRAAYEPGGRLTTDIENYVRPFGNEVILELKFTGRFPNWFRDLVQGFGLVRRSAAKYVDGVEAIGLSVFNYHPGPEFATAAASRNSQAAIPAR